MTNEEVIRGWSKEKIARCLVTKGVIRNEKDESSYVYKTGDGVIFEFFQDAVEHEITWLSEEYDPSREEEIVWTF